MFKILCIDDNQNNLFTLDSILNQLEGIAISFALSAQEGLSTLLTQEIDLILLDIQMPEMDGFAAAKLIKANKKTSNIPIIFLTAVFQSEEFKKKGFDAGAVEYLTKPIDDNKLLNKMRLYQRLIESEKQLREQKSYMQKIIDLQEQILIVIDETVIFSANQRFFDFFDYQDLNEFHRHHNCICQLFIDEEGFLPSNFSESEGKPWLHTILKYPEKIHLAIVKHLNINVFMMVNATLIDADKELYVVTLADVTQMHRMKEQFRHQALTDELTGAFNRTKFNAVFEAAISNSDKTGFTLAMLDIDHFKAINDQYGHLQGDVILKELVTLIEDNIRNEDVLARWGGEEFMLVFFASMEKIIAHVEKLRLIIAEHPFSGMDDVHITISMGVGGYSAGMDEDVFLKEIDDALCQAKQSGRNRIKVIGR